MSESGNKIEENDGQSLARDFNFVEQKLDRLTSALYAVTDDVSDQEPLKWKCRDISLKLLMSVARAYGANEVRKVIVLESLKDDIALINMILKVSSLSESFPRMNMAVLHREYYDLYKFIGTTLRTAGNFIEIGFGERLLLVRGDEDSTAELKGHIKKDNLKDIKRTDEIKDNNSPQIGFSLEEAKNEHLMKKARYLRVKSEKAITLKEKSGQGSHNTLTAKPLKSDRRERIYNFIAKNGESTIRDVTKVIDGCSEKTIQRELIAMVLDGVLSKSGERRWSRYRMVK